MTDITITDSSIPSLAGKHAVVTGGASGIGLAACRLLASRGAALVLLLDVCAPADDAQLPEVVRYVKCDVSDWGALQAAVAQTPRVDMVFANAARGQGGDVLVPRIDPTTGAPAEPAMSCIDTTYRGALNSAILGIWAMRAQGGGGSIVFTSSATALSSERGLPVYGSVKLGLVGLVRAWRITLAAEGITVNAVAPAATVTGMLPAARGRDLAARGLQVSTAEHVARALVFSAVAKEARRVEAYGAEKEADNEREGRWNGRVIWILGERYTEVEEPLQRLKATWLGERNLRDTRQGQLVTAGMF